MHPSYHASAHGRVGVAWSETCSEAVDMVHCRLKSLACALRVAQRILRSCPLTTLNNRTRCICLLLDHDAGKFLDSTGREQLLFESPKRHPYVASAPQPSLSFRVPFAVDFECGRSFDLSWQLQTCCTGESQQPLLSLPCPMGTRAMQADIQQSSKVDFETCLDGSESSTLQRSPAFRVKYRTV